MHRMRSLLAMAGVTLGSILSLGNQVAADLIRPRAVRTYPDIAADINGIQTYKYDPVTQTGTFQVTNTPYLLALDPSKAGELEIAPGGDGTRRQVVSLMLDRNGHLVEDPENTYALYGTVVLGGQTFSGLLLEGKPTAFGVGALAAGAEGNPDKASAAAVGRGKDIFDLSMKITGGALAGRFGPALYMRIVPAADTFNGQFTRDFWGRAARSNTRAYRASRNVPEPSTLLVLLAGGAALAFWRGRPRLPKVFERNKRVRASGSWSINRTETWPTACQVPHSRSGGRARGSDQATRRSP
jgi:hypothetical protein